MKQRGNRRDRYGRWGRLLLIFLGLLSTLQLLAFARYSQHSHDAEFKVNRSLVAKQVITLIQTAENLPLSERMTWVRALDIPNISLSLTPTPLWQPSYRHKSLLYMLWQISEQSPNIQLSINLDNQTWLNIQAIINAHRSNSYSLLIALEWGFILLVLLIIWANERYTQPLNRLIKTLDNWGNPIKKTSPLAIDGPVAVRQMAEAINQMYLRILELLGARTQLFAAISHDLRTPLTRLRLRIHMLEEGPLQEKCLADIEEMSHLLSETLAFAKIQGQAEKAVNLDLEVFLEALAQDFMSLGQPVTYTGRGKPSPYEVGILSLRRILNNLIENAIKYGEEARIILSQHDQQYCIQIRDKGPGIPVEAREKVFMPFYRLESSRSKETGGIGLGLAVVKELMLALGGEVQLDNHAEGGLIVYLYLPLEKPFQATPY